MGSIVRGRWDEALPRFERVLSFQDLESLIGLRGGADQRRHLLLAPGRIRTRGGDAAAQRRLHTDRGAAADFAHALGELGNTFMQQGDPGRRCRTCVRRSAVANESNLQADAAVWAGNLAAANIDLGEWNEAERFNDEARRSKPPAVPAICSTTR